MGVWAYHLKGVFTASFNSTLFHISSPAQAFLLITILPFTVCCVLLHRSRLIVSKSPWGGGENKTWLLGGSVKRQLLHLPGRGETWSRNCTAPGQIQLSRTWLRDGFVGLGNTIGFSGVVEALSRIPGCSGNFKLLCG